MRRIFLVILWQFGLLAGGTLFADVVTLKDGRQVSGAVEAGNTQELHVKVGDQSQTIDIHEVQAIQFGISQPAPGTAAAPPKAATAAPASRQPSPGTASVADQGAGAPPDSLILKDGTHAAGRWWSIDATDVHFLVANQLQHYRRPDVSAVTFAGATLPSPPPQRAPSAPTPATPAQPPPAAAPPARAPTLARPAAGTPPPAPSRRVSGPEELGMVYSWNGKDLGPLERTQAVPRGRGGSQYWEIASPQSRVRLKESPILIFVVRLQRGVNPASYSLFPLLTANGARRTRLQSGRQGGLVTWPFAIETNDESSLVTYSFTVKDLPEGEYSFSPSNSNDGYCFGVDPAPGQ